MPEAPSRLAERGGALLEGAAERSRTSMRTRFERLRLAWRSLVQTAAAATVAYLIASEVVGHSQPFFAPIAAIITLGITVGQRGRRAVELALGVAVGIAVADALVLLIGPGVRDARGRGACSPWAPRCFLGTGQIFANQAAVSAVLVAVLLPASRRLLGRALRRRADRRRRRAAGQLAAAARRSGEDGQARRRAGARGARRSRSLAIADAIEAREEEAAERALLQARELDELEADLQEAVTVSRETARFAPDAPPGARHRRLLRRGVGADRPRDPQRPRARARGAARRAAGREPPPAVADAVRDLADACRALRVALDDPERVDVVRTPALHAAATATRVLEETGNLSVTVVVGQVRSTAVDLLRGSGLTYEEAAALVREAARAVEDAEDAAT